MGKIYYCPECKNKLEELSGCGVVGYFCNTCNKLISRKIMLSEDHMQAAKKELEEKK